MLEETVDELLHVPQKIEEFCWDSCSLCLIKVLVVSPFITSPQPNEAPQKAFDGPCMGVDCPIQHGGYPSCDENHRLLGCISSHRLVGDSPWRNSGSLYQPSPSIYIPGICLSSILYSFNPPKGLALSNHLGSRYV